MNIRLSEIAKNTDVLFDGRDMAIKGINKIEDALADEISFLHNPKYFSLLETTSAGAVIVPVNFRTERSDLVLLRSQDPYGTFLKVLKMFHPELPVVDKGVNASIYKGDNVSIGNNPSIGPFVSIGNNTSIGDNVQIQANVTIGNNVKTGNNVTIYSNVSIRENCVIGNNVIIQNGAVIGSDGFGFAPANAGYDKIPQVGNVVIEDNVEIGANTCIDRATLGSTVVRKGAKLDNLLQIAHNVEIGANTVIAAQTGISGSTKIGPNCMIGGQAGFAGHIKIGTGCMIGAQAGVSGNLKDGSIVTGTPCREIAKQRKIDGVLGRLPELLYRVRDMEKKNQKPK